jgi:hypothetical protein
LEGVGEGSGEALEFWEKEAVRVVGSMEEVVGILSGICLWDCDGN